MLGKGNLTSFDELEIEGHGFEYPLLEDVRGIRDRALLILDGRSLEEINAAYATIQWMLESKEDELVDITNAVGDLEDAASPYSDRWGARVTWVRHLALYMQHFEIYEQDIFPNATWPEYFAVLALIRCKQLITEHNEQLMPKTGPKNVVSGLTYVRLCDALEAITYAEAIKMQEALRNEIETGHAEKIRLQSKKAAIARHAKTIELFRELVELYKSNSFTSYTECVAEFLKITDPKKYEHLAPTNRERTLRVGLSEIVRGIRQI